VVFAAITSQIGPAQVIGDDEDDVEAFLLCACAWCESQAENTDH
jgi:hypothetical protein